MKKEHFKLYKSVSSDEKEHFVELRPYVKGEDITNVKLIDSGDMPGRDMGFIARDPDNRSDVWYMSKEKYKLGSWEETGHVVDDEVMDFEYLCDQKNLVDAGLLPMMYDDGGEIVSIIFCSSMEEDSDENGMPKAITVTRLTPEDENRVRYVATDCTEEECIMLGRLRTMGATLNSSDELMFSKAFSGTGFRTEDGEFMGICMRDTGFEFNYTLNPDTPVWYSAQKGEVSPMQGKRTLSPSEAVYGFVGWLTSRDNPSVRMSSSCDAALPARLVDAFCKANELKEPGMDFGSLLIKYPEETADLVADPEPIDVPKSFVDDSVAIGQVHEFLDNVTNQINGQSNGSANEQPPILDKMQILVDLLTHPQTSENSAKIVKKVLLDMRRPEGEEVLETQQTNNPTSEEASTQPEPNEAVKGRDTKTSPGKNKSKKGKTNASKRK